VGAVTLVMRPATIDEILPLRHAVLRPGKPVSAAMFAGDELSEHVAAWDGGEVVGCATVFPDPWPGAEAAPAEPAAWRLRGMAVEPSRQGSGIGRQVLAAAVQVAAAAGAPLIWANARVSALPFYEANGWAAVGEEWDTPDTGLPHRKIVTAFAQAPAWPPSRPVDCCEASSPATALTGEEVTRGWPDP